MAAMNWTVRRFGRKLSRAGVHALLATSVPLAFAQPAAVSDSSAVENSAKVEFSQVVVVASDINKLPDVNVTDALSRVSGEAAGLEGKMAREKSGARMDELARRELQQRWLWTVIGGSFAMLGGAAYFLLRLRRKRNEIYALNIGLEQRVRDETAELRQQARYLRTLIDTLPVSVWLKDTGGRYLTINTNPAGINGPPAEQMIGKTDEELWPDGIGQAFRAADLEVMETRQRKMQEVAIPDTDGAIFWREIDRASVIDEDGAVLGTVGVSRDISERKRHEQSIQEQLKLEQVKLEQHLSSMAANVPGFVLTVRVGPDGHTSFPFASASVEDLFGLKPEEIRDDAAVLRARYHSDDLLRLLDLMDETERTLAPFRIEIRIRNRDNRQSWIEIRSMPQRQPDGATEWHGIMLDITERKRLEAELLDSRDFLNKILDGITDPVFVKDRAHRWILLNESFCKLIGHPRGELIGKSDYDFFPKEQADVFWEKDELVFSSGESNINEERFTDAGGVEYYIQTKKAVFVSGDQVFLAGVIRDITGRKHMEDTLRHSQESLAEAQRIGQMGSWELDLASGTLHWSDEVYRIFEIDPERFGASYEAFLNAIHPEDREAVNKVYSESLEKRTPYEIEHRLLFADGRIKHVRECCESHYDADGKPVCSIGTVQDITERKQMEEILRSKEEKLSGLFTLSPLGIALTDMQGRYVEFNEAFRKICGYPADELMTLNYWGLTPKEYEAEENEQLAALKKTGRYGPYEKEYRQKNGNLIPIQLNGVLVKGDDGKDYIWSIVEDITARKRMEEELQHREQMFRALAENAPDNIVRYDTAGRVVYTNPVLARTLCMQASDMIGTRPGDRHPDGSFGDYERALNNVIVSGRDGEIEQVLPDGSGGTLIHQVRMVAERNEEGDLIGVLAIGKDITDIKRYEAAREAALDEAMRLAKLHSEFLAHMSHELRTPLNGILGYAQILQRDRTMGEQNATALNVIRQSGEHLLALIDDILDMARIETGRFELVISDIPLVKFLHVVADIVSVKARQKDIDFSCDLAPDLPEGIRGDERRLRQVLLNLLSNAVKFTDRGGVVLHVSRVTPSRLAFAVQDSGIGIAENELEKIFHSFEQAGDAQHRHGGTGLGLAISRQLTRLMGGDIAVESRIGEGSTFRFELELTTVNIAPPSLLPVQVATGYAGPRRKVLVVDDVAENRAVVADMLVPLGFEMVDACDGIEALEMAQSTLPDLILMDIVMRGPGRGAGMNGMEATRRLRQLPTLAQVPIVMLSASAVKGDEERCLELGANAFMAKPFDQNQLLTLIASLLHLEWIVTPPGGSAAAADESAGKLVAPPAEAMQALHRLALLGNMRDIVRYAEHIRGFGSRYYPFAARLRQLADGYQSKAILAFVEEYLHDTST